MKKDSLSSIKNKILLFSLLGLLIIGPVFAQEIFIGSSDDYNAYNQELDALAKMAANSGITAAELNRIFLGSTYSYNTRVALADNLVPLIKNMQNLAPQSAYTLSMTIKGALNNTVNLISQINAQPTLDPNGDKLEGLLRLKDSLEDAYYQVGYLVAAVKVQQVSRLLSILSQPAGTVNTRTISWALAELPNTLSYNVYNAYNKSSSQIITALNTVATNFANDGGVIYVLQNTRDEVNLRWKLYTSNTGVSSDISIDLYLLNHSPNQQIKFNAYNRLFKGSQPLSAAMKAQQQIFLTSGTKDEMFFRDEVGQSGIILPQANITDQDLPPHTPSSPINLQGEAYPSEDGSTLQLIWTLMDSHYNSLITQFGNQARFIFPHAGDYFISFEIEETTAKGLKKRSLSPFLNIIYAPLPQVNYVLPDPITAGKGFLVGGLNFGAPQGSSYVIFSDGNLGKIYSWSDTTISCNVAKNASFNSLKIVTDSGESNVFKINLLATPASLSAARAPDNTVNLSWEYDGVADGFKIQRAATGGTFSQIATVGATNRTYRDTFPTLNSIYVYRIRAYKGIYESYDSDLSVSSPIAAKQGR